MSWYDALGNIGVALIICAYLLLQLGRIASNSLLYLIPNIIGAALILLSLSVAFNLSAFLMEVFGWQSACLDCAAG